MFLAKPTAAAGYQFYMYHAFHWIMSVIRLLPGLCAAWLFVAVRAIFVLILAFAAWIRNFSEAGFATWFLMGFTIYLLVHSCQERMCFWPEESCIKQDINERCAQELLSKEVSTQRNICDTLEHVRAALESKTRLELETKNTADRLKAELENSEQELRRLRYHTNDLNATKVLLEDQLNTSRQKNAAIKQDFQVKLDHLNESLKDIKNLEEHKNQMETLLSSEKDTVISLERENAMLQSTVDVMTKQRKQLVGSHTLAIQQLKRLEQENENLTQKLNDSIRMADNNRTKSLHKLTQKLQNSITSAKGKLSNVEQVLGSEEKALSDLSRRAVSPRA
ncbi:unnamed protein product [Clavelina lepadiformis]|uniref:Uncharacterized protein n=1 Tax=Clavelina lepadiformis TaxID=159417 RepID=A0ABP0G168_CLALP